MLQLQVIFEQQPREWVDAIYPFVTPITTALIAAGVALAVAAAQRKLVERDLDLKTRQLKKDLFDRRYSVYEGMRQFINHVVLQSLKEQTLADDYVERLGQARSLAPMLFGSDVVDWVESVLLATGELTADKYLMQGLGGERAVSTAARKMQLIEHLTTLSTQAVPLFQPYLEFCDVRDK